MNVSQLKAGVILTYLNQSLQIIIGLVYTPIMLRLLGQSEYGLYQLVSSVVSYLSLLSLGFGASYIRFYSSYKAKDDAEEIARLNGMFMTIFLVMALITNLVGGFLVVNIQWVFGEGLSNAEYSTARILMSIMVLSLALTFPISVFDSYITAHERFIFQRCLALLQTVLSPFLTLPVLMLGYGSVGMVLVSAILTIGKLLVDMWFCFSKLEIRFCFRGFKLSSLKEMWLFTFFIFLTDIINQVNWNVDKYLLGRMSGTVAVAIYGVGNTLRSMYVQFSTAISSVFIPMVNRLVAESKDDQVLTELMARVGRFQFVILILVLSGFAFFGRPFVNLWAGDNYSQSFWVALFIMIPGTVPLIQNLGIEIQIAKNKHRMRSVIYCVTAVGNIMMSIPLIRAFGPVGASIGTAIALLMGNILFMNVYYHTRVGIDMIYFWQQVLKLVPAILPNIACGLFVLRYVKIESWVTLFLCIVIYTVIYFTSMWLIGFNESEKKIFRHSVSRAVSQLDLPV